MGVRFQDGTVTECRRYVLGDQKLVASGQFFTVDRVEDRITNADGENGGNAHQYGPEDQDLEQAAGLGDAEHLAAATAYPLASIGTGRAASFG